MNTSRWERAQQAIIERARAEADQLRREAETDKPEDNPPWPPEPATAESADGNGRDPNMDLLDAAGLGLPGAPPPGLPPRPQGRVAEPARKPEPPPEVGEDAPTTVLLAAAPDGLTGFTRLPHALLDSGVVGLLERRCKGLGWLLLVMLRHAEMRDRTVRASQRTLCRKTGIGKGERLARCFRLLTRPWKAEADGTTVTVPALLTRGRSRGGRAPTQWRFRPEGLRALMGVVTDLLAAEATRQATIRKARQRAGTKGMKSRWQGR